MKKSFQSGWVNELTFIFRVSSKVRIYENLKNVFQEAGAEQFSISQENHKKSDTVENYLQIPLNLSSKNVKNAFFECMTRHRSKNEDTFLAFTFIALSAEPVNEELESESEEASPPPIPWATHPSNRAISNSLITKENPQPSKEKSLLKRIMGFFKNCFVKKSFPITQACYTLHAFDRGFENDAGSKNFKESLNIFRNKDPIYSKERKPLEDSGYETRESIRSTFSDPGYEIPHQVEPAVYLEVISLKIEE